MPDKYLQLLDSISTIKQYSKLLRLRDNVTKDVQEFPDYIARQIVDSINRRLDFLEHPKCDDVEITILLNNGSRRKLNRRECKEAAESGLRLSQHIFRRYPLAVDFEVILSDGGFPSSVPEEQTSGNAELEYAQLEAMTSKIEVVSKLIRALENNVSATVPKLSEDVREINRRVAELANKIRIG
ncbi:MAG TPA: hypothetical protein VKU79_04415 [Thermoplasmataceae archaeon]|nr:hypothetical protein [Thermoplasmatales archaeon AK]HLH86088.1 hypothetical protein [Thermoplasmataceae archaeon]